MSVVGMEFGLPEDILIIFVFIHPGDPAFP